MCMSRKTIGRRCARRGSAPTVFLLLAMSWSFTAAADGGPVQRHISDRAAERAKQPRPCPACEYVQRISPLARPSNSPRQCGYYVGGGAAKGGQPRSLHEGTWGWDYAGLVFPKWIQLDWWHGRRYQGGGGTYKTDGPHLPRPGH